MNKMILVLIACSFQLSLMAQKSIKVPMAAGRWEAPPELVTFLEYKSVPAMRILSSKGDAVLKDVSFSNGTIEFDIEPEDPNFAGIAFRRQDNTESEYFYLRVDGGTIPGALWAVQYAPIIRDVNLWDMLPYYQGPASYKRKEWNHIRLVVSGQEMLVYVNDMQRPALEVPRLEGNTTQGGIAFNGKAVIANLVIRPDAVDGLSPTPGFDPTYNDPRYIRQWKVSQPQPLPTGREVAPDDLPKADAVWQDIAAERRGLVNITRLYGKSESRRLVWLKTKLRVPSAQNRRVDLGFSDEVWIMLNGKLAFADKNLFRALMKKEPAGRCATENTSFRLDLQPGENELLVGVANDFYGWGIIAKLDQMEGIVVEP